MKRTKLILLLIFFPLVTLGSVWMLAPSKSHTVPIPSSSDASSEKIAVQKPIIHSGPNQFIDSRDGNVYRTVKIGHQTWMAENLNHGKLIQNTAASDNDIIEKTYFENNDSIGEIIGALYTWEEATNYEPVNSPQHQGICPDGWHLPTDSEFNVLLQYLDATTDTLNEGWSGSTIKDEFIQALQLDKNGMPYAGNSVGSWFFYKNRMSYFWTSTSFSNASAWYRSIAKETNQVYRGMGDRDIGMCIRCVMNKD